MPEKWEHELRKLRNVEQPSTLEGRVAEGPHPHHEPGRPTRERVAAAVVAFAVCAAVGVVAVTALRDDGGSAPPISSGVPVGEDVVVLHLSSNADGPTATVTYGDRSYDAVFEGASWCPRGRAERPVHLVHRGLRVLPAGERVPRRAAGHDDRDHGRGLDRDRGRDGSAG